MKKILLLLTCLVATSVWIACTPREELSHTKPNDTPDDIIIKVEDEDNYQIVMYTSEHSDSVNYTIADIGINEYSIKALHAMIPEDFNERSAEILADNIAFIEGNKIKAAIISQWVPGLVELISHTKERYPDILLIAITDDDTEEIIDIVDIVLCVDTFAMGKRMVEQAQRMDAENFFYYTFPSDLASPSVSSQNKEVLDEVLQEECSKFNIEYLKVADCGFEIDWVDAYVLGSNISKKIHECGIKTSFFVDSCWLQPVVIDKIAREGGFYAQPCHPSMNHGFIIGLGIGLGIQGPSIPPFNDFDQYIKEIEAKLTEYGSKGCFATWRVPFTMVAAYAAVEYARGYCEGRISGTEDLQAMRECFQKSMEICNSADTGFELNQHPKYPNCFMFTEDYIVLSAKE
jgi:hypothetical protein